MVQKHRAGVPTGRPVLAGRDPRPQLGHLLQDGDADIDWVVVDRLLRGWPVEANRAEIYETLRILNDLRIEYHGEQAVAPGLRFNDRMPYLQLSELVAQALGDDRQQFLARTARWRDAQSRRARYTPRPRTPADRPDRKEET